MNYEKIKSTALSKGITLTKLAENIGMSYQGINSAFKNNSLRVETLEKLSLELDVSPSYWYDDNIVGESTATYKTECRMYKELYEKALIDNDWLKNQVQSLIETNRNLSK